MHDEPMAPDLLDVLILGAGISGIGAACHLRRQCPDKRFVMLERRDAIGGTWDLFRYPGIRSDSDMLTFGYRFRPWTEPKVLADGEAIRRYLDDTVAEYDLAQDLRLGRHVLSADWSSRDGCWTLQARRADGQTERYRARFLIACTGYFNYDAGYAPHFPGEADFAGRIVHPQHWPADLDYRDQRVVVIGSGATAVTLVPALTEKAAHVTMLQRSPGYVLSLPAIDPLTAKALRLLPTPLAYRLTRLRNIALARAVYVLSRAAPEATRRLLLSGVRRQLQGAAVDMRHFTPRYAPWDERLCVVPNGDLFHALRQGRAAIVTDHIERFTPTGLTLRSGASLPADLVVKATGLDLQMLGGIALSVDGAPVHARDRLIYKGVLIEDVPNAAMVFGYTNASWTLKVDLSCDYLCRLLQHMDRHGYRRVTPRDRVGLASDEPIFGGLASGYIRRAADLLPRQGKAAPWKLLDDYPRDALALRFGRVADRALEFSAA